MTNIKYLSEACSAIEHIMEVITALPSIDMYNMDGEILQNVSGQIEFRPVEFAYPSRRESTILRDFCLSVPAGKTEALIGSSGSGKSTIISLLQRFNDPCEGEILLDGVPINKLQLKWLRSLMGLVSQEPILFGASIKDNILLGKEDATTDEKANVHYQVGERDIQLSGGQKQRIAIVLAIIKAPKILLLDEATSALDSESEQTVQEALNEAMICCTTIIIAHRLTTIQNANIIAILRNGQIMEMGSHKELMKDFRGCTPHLSKYNKWRKKKQ
ncbi:ABC transporter-like, ATP-binding domain [Dillenia turbinata]|uniref:ABC transporter-like, ATP-binding domain n=1 Tax=Dillenia turbinata TaxID=194707 RepID=A0AAN8V7M3_9MAGN